MNRAEFVGLTKRLMEHAENGTTDQAENIYRVPIASYVDPDIWQEEIDVIFKRVPLLMALSCELPKNGSFKALDVVGVPVLVIRGTDGKARAFLNVCRHRGAEIVGVGCGEARRLTCPYHGWSYDSNGHLAGVYGRESFGEIDAESMGLTELGCDEQAGMIFACLTPGIAVDARAWLCGFDEILEPFHMEDWHVISRRELDGANWKVCYDGYLEGYHFSTLHRETIFKATMSNTMTYDAFGPHQRVGFPKHGIELLRNKPEEEWGNYDGISLVCTLFPNISFAFSPDGTMVSQLFPGPTSDRSHTHQTVYRMTPVLTDEDRERSEARADFLYEVVRDEDYATGLGIQRGLTSGANAEFVFGRNELGLHRFHQSVAEFMGRRH